MSNHKSFKELKRENAEKEAQLDNVDDGQQVDIDENEALDDADLDAGLELDLEEEHDDEVEEGDDTTEDDGNDSLESWISEEGKKPPVNGVPVNKHIKLRAKMQKERDENAELRAENERLKSGNYQPQQSQHPLDRPRRSEFKDEFGVLDEDKYDAAVDEWNLKRLQQMQSETSQQAQQSQLQKQAAERQNRTINDHYDGANKLVEAGKVTEEVYQSADLAIRQRFESEVPGNGDLYADGLIEQVNIIAGKEKAPVLWFKLGKDANSLEKVVSAFKVSQNEGLKALSEISSSLKMPSKKTSRAPKAPKQVQGDKGAKPSGSAMKRKVEQARKQGNMQQVISLKRQAKQQGLNVTDW